MSKTVVDILLSDNNYIPSELWRQKDIHVESEAEMLAVGVPRSMTLYKSKVLERIVRELNEQLLRSDITDEEQSMILQKLSRSNSARVVIARKLDRLLI